MPEHEVIAPEKKVADYAELASKRGLDLPKVQWVMAREQEHDLKLVYRCDEVQLFMDMPVDDRRRYNWEKKPSDKPLIQALWTANRNYIRASRSDDEKLALQWFDRVVDIIDKVQDMRREAMDRLMEWKRHEESKQGDIDPMELYKIAQEG